MAGFATSAPSVAAQTALHATGGTYNFRADGGPGTVVFYTWQVGSEPFGPFVFLLRGPAGWGGTRNWRVARAGTGLKWDVARFVNPAVNGVYTLVVNGHEASVTATFSISSLAVLPKPSVKVTLGRDRVEVGWTAVPGALSYQVSLVDLQTGRALEQALTRTTGHAFAVVLFAGPYRADVLALPLDFTGPPPQSLPAQLNCSEGMAEFAVP